MSETSRVDLAKTLFDYLDKPNVRNAIFAGKADGVDVEEWVGAYKQAVKASLNEKLSLADCTIDSNVKALTDSATTGLKVGSVLGHAYAVARNVKVGERNGNKIYQKQAIFQPGYLGLLKLAYESPLIKAANAEVVHANDKFEIHSGTDPKVTHALSVSDPGQPIGCYAIVWCTSGVPLVRWMTAAQIEVHKDVNVEANSYAWGKKGWRAMWRKTVAKDVLKYAPLRSEVRQILQQAEYDESGVEDDRLRSGDTIKAESSRPLVAAIGADTAGVTLPAEFGDEPIPDTRSASRRASDELFCDGAPSPEEAPELYAQ